MNKKEELQVEKPSTKTQGLKAIFQRESGLKQRIKRPTCKICLHKDISKNWENKKR
jgi:hypothetical protein